MKRSFLSLLMGLASFTSLGQVDQVQYVGTRFFLAQKNGQYSVGINTSGNQGAFMKEALWHLIELDQYYRSRRFNNPAVYFMKLKSKQEQYRSDTSAHPRLIAYSLEALSKESEALYLTSQQFKAFPRKVLAFTQLKVLVLYDCQIRELPKEITRLRHLEQLDLRSNQLSALPESLGELQHLQRLYVSDNQLVSLPKSVGQLKQLKIVDVGDNLLQELPKSVAQLQNLIVLDMSNNALPSLPKGLSKLRKLKIVDLAYNNIAFTHFSVLKTAPFKKLQNLEAVDLSGNGLIRIPTSFGQLQGLKILYLQHNDLHQLPDSFSNLKKLQRLDLRDNHISAKQKEKAKRLLPDCRIGF